MVHGCSSDDADPGVERGNVVDAGAGGQEPAPEVDAGSGEDDAGEVDAGEDDAAIDAGVDAGPPVSAGCSGGADLPEGAGTISVGGKTRKYVVRKPTGATNAAKAWPLILALHPNGSNTGYYDVTTGARAIRPLVKDKAIVILGEADDGDWRGDLAGELAYWDALITKVEGAMCIDKTRIFSMGFSGGGSFSGMLGCNRTDIRAIASGGAVIYFDPKNCVGKPAAWVTIGDDEAIQGRIDFREFWRTAAACGNKTTKVPPAATCVAYDCPDPARPVEFCSHAGGHEWPAFGANAAWLFFSKF